MTRFRVDVLLEDTGSHVVKECELPAGDHDFMVARLDLENDIYLATGELCHIATITVLEPVLAPSNRRMIGPVLIESDTVVWQAWDDLDHWSSPQALATVIATVKSFKCLWNQAGEGFSDLLAYLVPEDWEIKRGVRVDRDGFLLPEGS